MTTKIILATIAFTGALLFLAIGAGYLINAVKAARRGKGI